MEEICLLCDVGLDTKANQVIKQRAINKLIEVSRRRKDRRLMRFKNLTSLTVHRSCLSNYGRESGILRASKSQDYFKHEKANAEKFDLKKCCFFCNKEFSQNFPINTISFVINDSLGMTIQEKINNLDKTNDELILLKLRVENKDLVQENAWYHRKCLTLFHTSTSGEKLSENVDDNF